MIDTATIDDWLQARHSHWNTPRGLINEYVRKATGSVISQASRVILGTDNEVYDVTTADNHQLIVRISHKENLRFYIFLLVLKGLFLFIYLVCLH